MRSPLAAISIGPDKPAMRWRFFAFTERGLGFGFDLAVGLHLESLG